LLNNPALADELGENGSVYVRETYNWDHVLDVVEKGIEIARDNFRNR
jgi:hypothetical protein